MRRLCFILAAGFAIAGRPDSAPSISEQHAILERVRQNALQSQEQLPDFLCTQLTRRSEDPTGKGKRLRQRDTLEIEFSFVDRKPDWKLLKLNGASSRLSYDDLRNGFISEPILQFFSLPGSIFGGEAQSKFAWKSWATVNGRRTAVFRFEVARSESHLAMTNEFGSSVAGFGGLMYADAATDRLVRLEVKLDLPGDQAVRDCSIDVDYGLVTIGNGDYDLPVKAVARLRTLRFFAQNETEVVRYQKYSADSTVQFGPPER